MPKSGDKYVNPFFREIFPFVDTELKTRGAFYGRRVRGVGSSIPKNVIWSYQKTAFGRVISKTVPGIVLGFPGSKLMSDRQGNLTLYSADRNVPKRPLLTSIDVSNEGQMGSLLKGKFSFTAFPVLGESGFSLGNLDAAFFTPGNEVEISFGWSVHAASSKACTLEFTGVISGFNWSFNNDMSITADVSVVSAASVSIGVSGDQSVPKDDGTTPEVDPADKFIDGVNLITQIDKDLLSFKDKIVAPGKFLYVSREDDDNNNKKGYFDYVAISMPTQELPEEESTNQTQQATAPPPVENKTFWFISLTALVEFVNKLIERYEASADSQLSGLFEVIVEGNETQYYNQYVRSAYPTQVFFPDKIMGAYGNFKPYENTSPLTDGIVNNETCINIGRILLSTDYLKDEYKKYLDETSTNITFRNITKFIEKLIKRINQASGDMYQLTAQMLEDDALFRGSGSPSTVADKLRKAKISIEDSNIPKAHSENIHTFKFDGRIFKPLIKSVQISSSPPSGMTAAAFVAARPAGKTKALPSNNNNSTATKKEKELDKFQKEELKAIEAVDKAIESINSGGFNEKWSELFRGGLVGIKKFRTGGNAHWLNQALYPINFSVTIDGINGFKFGDTIETNLIPTKYSTNDYRLLFTVTKVNHSVKDGIWETTLNTAARLNMGD